MTTSRLALISCACFCILSAVLISLTYHHVVGAGFFLDDTTSIRDQLVMMSADPSSIPNRFPMRSVGYFSFWANYQWSGESAAAFRLTNLAIHWLSSLVVFVLCVRLFSASQAEVTSRSLFLATFAAILFLCHPLQTGAVTYIVQRIASLAALFFLIALTTWLFLRTTKKGVLTKFILLLVFIGSTLLALNTKQNTFTLFPVIVLLELLVLRGLGMKNFSVGCAALFLGFLLVAAFAPDKLSALDAMTREAPLISRWDYFSHQWVVLFIYLKKIFWPAPLMLEYGYDTESFSLALRLLAGVGHLLVISAALLLVRFVPLVSFGVLFFYVTHSVESGLIPIRDLVFEHRNYLPLAGISIALASAGNCLVHTLPQYKKHIFGASLIAVVAFSVVTYDRNKLWNTPKRFLEHDVRLSGGSPRALHNLASWYQQDGQYDKALETMRELIKANDGGLSLTHSTTYLAVLLNVRLYNDVLDLTEKLLDFSANSYERAIILRYMGTAFTGVADDEAAVDAFEEAMRTLQLDYDSGLAYGYSLIQLGRVGDAFKHIESMRQRFGDRTKLRMLAKVADTALQTQRAAEAANTPD